MDLSSARFAEYASELTADSLPPAVVERTERLVLDSLACCIGGYASPPSKVLRDLHRGRAGSDGRATVIGSGELVDVEYAALINSTMGRFLDFNDCYTGAYGGGHPSDHIPSLLAVAEAEGATGAELVEAVVLAYDIQCRGIETGAAYEHSFDYQAVWAGYSAPAAVGKLMGLSQAELVNAIGITGTANNGLLLARRGEVSMWKGLAVPYVIHNAIQACQMAQRGLTGPTDLFEGPGGVFEVVTRGPVEFADFSPDDHRVMRTNVKAHAGCYQSLSAVAATIDLVTDNEVDPSSVESIHVRTYQSCINSCGGPEKWDTDLSRESADHSLPYMLAVAVLDGDLTPDQYAADRLRDPVVHDLMGRVSVENDDELNRRRERTPGILPTVVEIDVGRTRYRAEVEYPPGHYERPLTAERHDEKVVGLLSPSLTAAQIERVMISCESLSDLDDVGSLVESLVV